MESTTKNSHASPSPLPISTDLIFTIDDEESSNDDLTTEEHEHDEESNSLLLSSPPDPPSQSELTSTSPSPPTSSPSAHHFYYKWINCLTITSVLILLILLVSTEQQYIANLQISANQRMHEETLAQQGAQFLQANRVQREAVATQKEMARKAEKMHKEALATQKELAKKARVAAFLASLASREIQLQEDNRNSSEAELEALAEVARDLDAEYYENLKNKAIEASGVYVYQGYSDSVFLGQDSNANNHHHYIRDRIPFWYVVVLHFSSHIV